jgi:PAS domain S-box-containing protein
LLWNRVATEWLGLSAEEAIGRTDFDFFPHEQAAFFQQKDHEVMESGRTQEIPDEPIQSRDGEMRFMRTTKTPIFDELGRPLALLAVSENITESKRTAAELEATMQRLRNERNLFHALLDHLPVCAFAKSAREQDFGTYVMWNRVMEADDGGYFRPCDGEGSCAAGQAGDRERRGARHPPAVHPIRPRGPPADAYGEGAGI